jgi:hypothetical protein
MTITQSLRLWPLAKVLTERAVVVMIMILTPAIIGCANSLIIFYPFTSISVPRCYTNNTVISVPPMGTPAPSEGPTRNRALIQLRLTVYYISVLTQLRKSASATNLGGTRPRAVKQ